MTLLANASRLGCADTGRDGTSRPVFIDLVAEVVPDSDFYQVREMLPESEDDENWGQLFEIVDAGGWEPTTQS